MELCGNSFISCWPCRTGDHKAAQISSSDLQAWRKWEGSGGSSITYWRVPIGSILNDRCLPKSIQLGSDLSATCQQVALLALTLCRGVLKLGIDQSNCSVLLPYPCFDNHLTHAKTLNNGCPLWPANKAVIQAWAIVQVPA
jgi:hypothetical protein